MTNIELRDRFNYAREELTNRTIDLLQTEPENWTLKFKMWTYKETTLIIRDETGEVETALLQPDQRARIRMAIFEMRPSRIAKALND